MDKFEERKQQITMLETRLKDFEGRSLNETEKKVSDEMRGMLHELKSLPASAPLSMPGSYGVRTSSAKDLELRSPGQQKDYEALFGKRSGVDWTDKECSFLQAVFSGRMHPGLTTRSMAESVPSDGGFLVPSSMAASIHNVSLESEVVMPRCYVQPMQTNEFNIPAMVIGSHATALMGGFTASYTAETGTINENNPKVRSMKLNAKKLTGLIRFSSELAQDVVGGERQIIDICGKGLAWYRDQAFLKGTGAGQPLGILNSGCLVSVAKEAGQRASTICYENLVKMMARCNPGSFKNSLWIVHQNAIPQLMTLSVAVGTGGSHIPVMSETNGQFTILTRPVIFTEKTETLGAKGDIILADLSQYVVGLRLGMSFDVSIHVAFSTDEILARLIERHDGQPLWDAPLTLADGTTTVSPFVTLDARV